MEAMPRRRCGMEYHDLVRHSHIARQANRRHDACLFGTDGRWTKESRHGLVEETFDEHFLGNSRDASKHLLTKF